MGDLTLTIYKSSPLISPIHTLPPSRCSIQYLSIQKSSLGRPHHFSSHCRDPSTAFPNFSPRRTPPSVISHLKQITDHQHIPPHRSTCSSAPLLYQFSFLSSLHFKSAYLPQYDARTMLCIRMSTSKPLPISYFMKRCHSRPTNITFFHPIYLHWVLSTTDHGVLFEVPSLGHLLFVHNEDHPVESKSKPFCPKQQVHTPDPNARPILSHLNNDHQSYIHVLPAKIMNRFR